MGSLVDAGAIPYTNVDVEAIRSGASSLQSAAGEVRSGGAAVVSAWRPISGVYRGPGDAQLFAAMDPVGSSSTAFGDDLDQVAGALRSFADQVEPIVAKLKALHADALALGGRVAAFKPHQTWSWMALGDVSVDSWDQDESLNNENNRIINGVADQMVEYEAAERACANAIRSIAGLPPLHALTGAKDDPLGYGYSAIPAGTKLPWGQSADREESCSEKTATFVPSLFKGIVVDGVGGTLAGLGQMVGITVHDWNFSWSWDTVTTTWGAMGSLISYNPQTGQWGDWSGAGEAWKSLGKGTIAWDEWAKDPGAAAGATIFNVGSLLVPVVGEVGKVGAVGRVGEAAGDASKLSKLAAIGDLTDPVSLVAKGAHLALPKLSDLASALGSKFDDLKGLVSDHMPNFKDGTFHFEGAHDQADVPVARAEPAPHVPQPVAEPTQRTHAHAESGQTDHTAHGVDLGNGTGAPTHGPSGWDGSSGRQVSGGSEVDHTADDGGHHGNGASTAVGVTEHSPESPHSSTGAAGLVDSTEHYGPGWERTQADDESKVSGTDQTGEPFKEHGNSGPYPTMMADDPRSVMTWKLVDDPEAPYGRDPKTGHAYSKEAYDERFVMQNDNWDRYPPYDGVVPGSRVTFTDPAAFLRYYGGRFDRIGDPSGRYLGVIEDGQPPTFEQRSLPISALEQPYHAYSFTKDAARELAESNVQVEVSRAAPAFGREGGALQVRFLQDGKVLRVRDLVKNGWLEWLAI